MFWSEVLEGFIAFCATEVDDFVCLLILFARAHLHPEFKTKYIWFGQFVGFSIIYMLSLLGIIFGLLIPPGYMGLMGIVPIVIGISILKEQCSEGRDDYDDEDIKSLQHTSSNSLSGLDDKQTSEYGSINDVDLESFSLEKNVHDVQQSNSYYYLKDIIHPQTLQTALIVIGNSGDNIAIYVPLFADSNHSSLAILFVTFYISLILMLLLSSFVINSKFISSILSQYGSYFAGMSLIGIGVYILMKSFVHLEDI
jgi:cadmium resistance protein CadD (predicted permease)